MSGMGLSLASEVAGHKSTMADSDSRGSERPEDSEPGWKRLENLVSIVYHNMKQYLFMLPLLY